MKNTIKVLGIIALVAVIGFSFAACGGGDDGNGNGNGDGNGSGNGNGTDNTAPSVSYIITGSGTTFTATKNGATVGTANQTITNVISAIQTDANGANAAIQFGNGTAVLDIGSDYVLFSNTGGTWGSIIISGKLTSLYSGGDAYTIYIMNGISVISTADITHTRTNGGQAILNNGALTITSGTVSGVKKGVQNAQQGTLIINGGTVSATDTSSAQSGIQNYGGTLTINSGNVSIVKGSGISNEQNGTVTINGGTVSSDVTAISNSSGTVTIKGGTVSSTGSNTNAISNDGTLNISNGTIRSTGTDATTINNKSGKTLTITGGTIESTGNNGKAIGNSGTATISGGTVSATGSSSYAVYNYSGGTVTVTGTAVINGSKYGY